MNMRRLLSSNAPAATVLIRLLVGAVFLSEGILKFLIWQVETGKLGVRFPNVKLRDKHRSK